jgi:endonuclease/exonuclease/phosphatase family metal-dependent hydrolase
MSSLRIFLACWIVVTAAAADPLHVLCYNLRYITPADRNERAWTARREQAAKLIRADRSDVIGFQEALRPMLDDLAARVPGYEEIGVGREDGRTQGEYSALWIRRERLAVEESGTFWLSDTPDVPNSMTWGNRVTRICTWARLKDQASGHVFHVFNAHFDHQSQPSREKATALILQRLGQRTPAGPVLFLGDLNAAEGNRVHDLIHAHPLQFRDVWRSHHPLSPRSASGTLHGFSGRTDGGRIDYIYASPEWRIDDAEIVRTNERGIFPSDHFPVRATLRLP